MNRDQAEKQLKSFPVPKTIVSRPACGNRGGFKAWHLYVVLLLVLSFTDPVSALATGGLAALAHLFLHVFNSMAKIRSCGFAQSLSLRSRRAREAAKAKGTIRDRKSFLQVADPEVEK